MSVKDEVDSAINDLKVDLDGNIYGTTSSDVFYDPNSSTADCTTQIVTVGGTSTDNIWGHSAGDVVFSDANGWNTEAVITIGPLQISATAEGEVEVVLKNDDFREEYHFSATTMRGLLRKLADVVVEGKET
jgi:hypothetical protein